MSFPTANTNKPNSNAAPSTNPTANRRTIDPHMPDLTASVPANHTSLFWVPPQRQSPPLFAMPADTSNASILNASPVLPKKCLFSNIEAQNAVLTTLKIDNFLGECMTKSLEKMPKNEKLRFMLYKNKVLNNRQNEALDLCEVFNILKKYPTPIYLSFDFSGLGISNLNEIITFIDTLRDYYKNAVDHNITLKKTPDVTINLTNNAIEDISDLMPLLEPVDTHKQFFCKIELNKDAFSDQIKNDVFIKSYKNPFIDPYHFCDFGYTQRLLQISFV